MKLMAWKREIVRHRVTFQMPAIDLGYCASPTAVASSFAECRGARSLVIARNPLLQPMNAPVVGPTLIVVCRHGFRPSASADLALVAAAARSHGRRLSISRRQRIDYGPQVACDRPV